MTNDVTNSATRSARLISIDLDRQEGARAAWRSTTFAGANRVLRDWAQTAPKQGGYDKVAVVMRWENGVEHRVRHDLKHPSTGATPNLEQDLRYQIEFAQGRQRRGDWTDERHAAAMKHCRESGLTAAMQRVESTCEIGDLPTERHDDAPAWAADVGDDARALLSDGWVWADERTRDWQPGAVLMRQLGGPSTDFATFDFTLLREAGAWIPVHGAQKMPAVATPGEAAAALFSYWDALPDATKLAWTPANDKQRG